MMPSNTTQQTKTTSLDFGFDSRTTRARSEQMSIRQLRDGRHVIETDGGTYVVDTVEGTCTCPDHAIRGSRCKHLRRVTLEIESGLRVPQPKVICAACGIQMSDRIDGNIDRELPLCATCNLSHGDLVRDRETGHLLVVAHVTDDRADAVEIENTDGTVASYHSNTHYGPQEPVVEAIYLTDHLETRHAHFTHAIETESGTIDNDDLPHVYLFPRTRLQRLSTTTREFADLRLTPISPDSSSNHGDRTTIQTTLVSI